MRKPLVALSASAAAALSAVALSACGTSSSTAAAPASTAPAATAPAAATPKKAAAPKATARTRNASEVVHSVDVTMGGTKGEFSMTPVPDHASPGEVTFHVRNAGATTHEMVVVKTPKAAGDLAPKGSTTADETGSLAETEDMAPGATKDVTTRLTAGHYVLLCNLPGHYMNGMRVDFTVR